jgi:polyisoprenoid-binding protein YceI
MKTLILSIVLVVSTTFYHAQTKWNCDPVHSSINFSVGYLGISQVTGQFKKYEGKLESKTVDFSDSKFEFSVDVASINTEIEARDNHLKSADFFDVANFKTMTFSSTSFKKAGKNSFKLEGNMTMHGITKKMTFVVTYGGEAKDNYGNERAGFTINGKLKRSDFQVNGAKGVVADEVSFNLNFNFIKSK